MVNETNKDIILENMLETEVELANPPTDDSSMSMLADPDPEDGVEAYISTYEIYRNWDTTDKLEYALRDVEDAVATLQTDKADVSHTHDGYASSSHTHDGYVSSSDLEVLEDVIDTKANSNHTHSEYASINHVHDGYVSQTDFDTLADAVDGKADSIHSHTEYALTSHEHDYADVNHNHDTSYSPVSHSHSDYVTTTDFDALETTVSGKADENHIHTGYSEVAHNHDSDYADVNHDHNTTYATVGHDHDEDYAIIDHVHSDYVTTTSLNEISAIVSGKADSSHSHNDIYYTETEVDTKLANKSDVSHAHTGVYDASGSAASALVSAKEYTDSKIDALVGEGASTTLDTIGEISSAIEDNQDAIDILNSAIANKANASDLTSHANDADIHITETERNNWNAKSNFSGNYNDLTNKPSIPSISGLATETYVDEAVNTKADSGHTHGDIYYTETEVDSLLSSKANSNHNHNNVYDALGTAETKANVVQANLDVVSEDLTEHIDNASIHFTATERTKLSGIATNANNYTHPNSGITAGTYKSVTVNAQGHVTAGVNPTTLVGYGITDAETKGAANSALTSAKAYADELIEDEVANRDTAIATAKSSAISTAASDATTKANNALASAKTYADNAAATVKNDLLNGAGTAYDTLKELGDLIDDNVDAIEALEAVAAGKANAVHTHAISDIANLQSALDSKASASHGTHVSYSTTSPAMDGTASVGSASTVARSDHKHPTDTSRASQSDLDTHTSDTTKHITSTERANWNAAYNHSQSAHAPNNAEPNQNAFSNIKIGDVTIAADIKTDTLTLVAGDNVTITPDATNDKITISAKDTTYTLGSFGVTATAAELNKLKGVTASTTEINYVDGVTSNIQTQIDGKAAKSHTHTVSNISDLTATVTELNYMDGVTSSVQTQLDEKASSSHTHNYAGSSSAGGAATSANKVNKTLTVQLNSGATEGTNKFTFDGSAAKSLNITPSSIGAAASSHTHDDRYYTETEIDGKVSTLNTAINGKASSSHTHTIANITNLQSTLDGKSATSHTHSYAGSSSVGGSATSAVKLDTSTAGDANTPVYFSGGKPVACTSLDLNTSGSSASCTGNSATATKLQTARSIGLDTGVTGTATSFNGTGNITIPVTDVKESYLSWGGKNLSGSVSPIDAACSNIHSANRFAFAKPAGITIEYSTNGSTYSAYSTTDSAKINLVSGVGSTYYIGARSSSTTVNDKLRITLNATNMGLYTRLRKLLINISTSYAIGSNVIIEKAMKGSETTYTTIGTYQISGWSGWNSIPINAAFGGGSNQTGNIANLRLTFGITGVNSEQTSNALQITDIIGIGDTYWSYPSTMAKTGHIYSYDSSQNTTFPANVTATTFVGALSGNATTATTATNVAWSGVTSKPSYYDAKAIKSITRSGTTFTYTCMDGTTGTFTQQDNNTTYSVATTSANGLMSASDKTKLNAMELATLTEVKTYLGI